MVHVPKLALDIHLLPVTKIQFETYISEPIPNFGTNWYHQILSLNPRVSHNTYNGEHRERLFISGLFPKEIIPFAKWLGEGYDLPTKEEWRETYRSFQNLPIPSFSAKLEKENIGLGIFRKIANSSATDRLVDASLMNGGLAEWVFSEESKSWVGLGKPVVDFYPNGLNPLLDEFKPLDASNVRLKFFGFRLVRRKIATEVIK